MELLIYLIVLIQFLLLRPFLDPYEVLKIVLVCMIHVILLTVSSFPSSVSTRLNIPSEIDSLKVIEKPSLGCQSSLLIGLILLTSFWTIILTRWSIPCLYFNQNKATHSLYRWIPIDCFIGLIIVNSVPGGPSLSSLEEMFCWVCPLLIFLWYGAGNYFIMRIRSSLFSVIVPTLYVYSVNWIISTEENIKISNSSVEPMLILGLVNFSIALSNLAFDKSKCILDLCPIIYRVDPAITWNNLSFYLRQMVKAFLKSEADLPTNIVDDFKACISVLGRNSLEKFFKLFPSGETTSTYVDVTVIPSRIQLLTRVIR